MKKLLVLATLLAFSFAVMAQCPGKAGQTAKEKTCTEWQAEGKCPKADGKSPCGKADGKCPKDAKPCATADAKSGGGCAKAEGQSSCCNSKKEAEKPAAKKGGRSSKKK
jgi:hypothetical protein